MTILNSNGNVGIGTTNPGTYKLYVNGSTYMNGTTYLNGTSNIIGDLNISKSGSYSNISQYSYSDVNWHGGRISFSRYRGTQTSPTTVLNQDYVGWFDFYGYDGAASQRVGTILIQVDGTPASGKVPGKFAIQTSNNDGVFVNRLVAYANDNIVMGLNGGKVGIGNASPNAKLEVKDGLILINGYDAVYTTNDQLGNKHQLIGTYQGWDKNTIYIAGYNNFNNSTYSTKYISFGGPIANGVGERMFINLLTGKIGIGTTTPDSLLTVRGGIHARSVVVDLVGPLADYVFEPDYNLMPLNEVESFVKKNKHLPSIPSAKDVENKGGVNIGEMQNKLLEKIEELTLYVIQQQKEIDALKEEIKRK